MRNSLLPTHIKHTGPLRRLRKGCFPVLLPVLLFLSGCGVSKSGFTPDKKYSLREVQRDYRIYQGILQEYHPGLYWYTPKEEMDGYFTKGWESLRDSLTEIQFRKILSYVTSKINCGHTSVRPSRAWNKYSDTARLGKMFPLSMKIWDEAMVVTANLNRKDTVLKRGTVVTAINGMPWKQVVDSLMRFMPGDGFNRTGKNQSLSNRGFFGSLYSLVFGLQDSFRITYLDSMEREQSLLIPVHDPATDSGARVLRAVQPPPPPSKKEYRRLRQNNIRLLRIDTVNRSALLTVASFGRGYKLKKFFQQSFRTLQQRNIQHLIVDVRTNGGGSVSNSTQLTRYLANRPFTICDSLYAVSRSNRYSRYIQHHFWNHLFVRFFTRTRRDGNYHFGYVERHRFKPKKKYRFTGKAYILTGGNSFSATTLFASVLREQENITLVGEETGGGGHGNSAWLIPDVTLPETGVRFRLPLFRLVMDKRLPQDGRGVQPEVMSLPTPEAVRKNNDFKMEKAMDLIRKDQGKR